VSAIDYLLTSPEFADALVRTHIKEAKRGKNDVQ